MKFSRSIKFLIASLVLFTAAVASAVGASFWVQKQTTALKESMQIIANEESLVQDQTKASAILAASADDRAELNTYVIQGNEGVVDLLSEIDELAVLLGVDISTAELKVEDTDGRFGDLLLSLNLNGPEQQVLQAVSMFETMPYVSEVTSLNLARVSTVVPESAEDTEVVSGPDMMAGKISLQFSIVEYD